MLGGLGTVPRNSESRWPVLRAARSACYGVRAIDNGGEAGMRMRTRSMTRVARLVRIVSMIVALLAAAVAAAPPVSADLGDCAQPVSTGAAPVASDCLFILNVAVGADVCAPACTCAPRGTLPTTASDALVCLAVAVGGSTLLSCPCPVATTTTTAAPTTTTTTSSTTSSTTTVTVTTTTVPDACTPNPCQNGGTCFPSGPADFFCACVPDWTGPTCGDCGYACSEDPDYYRSRFLSCVVDTEFCDRPYATCPEFCAGWMGCTGDLYIDETYGTVAGPPGMCV